MHPSANEPSQNNSIKIFAREALHDLTHFDSKFFKSVKPLITKPGFLTTQAFTPAQTNYIKPLALFVFLNFIFFIFKSKGLFLYTLDMYNANDFFKQTIADHIADSHLTAAVFAERFNTSMKFEQQEYVIVMVPLFSLFIHLLYFRTKRFYIEHLIFSLHFYSFVILFLILISYGAIGIKFLVSLANVSPGILLSEVVLDTTLFVVISTYLYAALKRVYKQKNVITIIKTLLSTACFFFLIAFVYRLLLFYIVLHTASE